MKKIKSNLISILSTLVVGVFFIFYAEKSFPTELEIKQIYSSRLSFQLSISERSEEVYTKYMTETQQTDHNTENLCEKSIAIDGHRIVYNSLGHGDKTILLVHGLFGSKKQWIQFAQFLAYNGYHVIIPDLPGYGKSQGFPEKDYSIDRQVELLHKFISKLGLKKIDLAGNSMGGLIAAKYTEKYPNEVITLAFIGAPLGIKSPRKSIADEIIENGGNPFVPLNVEAFNKEMALLFTNPLKLSKKQIKSRIQKYQKEQEKDNRIVKMIYQEHTKLNTPSSIMSPTLIIWGNKDNIFDVSGEKILKANIKNSRSIIVNDGSHLLFMESPKIIADYYLQFLKER